MNSDPTIAHGDSGDSVIAYTSAETDFDLNSTPTDIPTSLSNADIMIVTETGGVWSPPAVHVPLPGQDGLPALVRGPSGMFLLAWVNLNNGATSVYVSLYDGATWTTDTLSTSASYE